MGLFQCRLAGPLSYGIAIQIAAVLVVVLNTIKPADRGGVSGLALGLPLLRLDEFAAGADLEVKRSKSSNAAMESGRTTGLLRCSTGATAFLALFSIDPRECPWSNAIASLSMAD
ncbi:hypothetical protein [Pseudomonas nitroreducens]|uniref:hypothetical protein n=1 Tax=Pseudomonas nitroreducens TaxID=46680 RepID=UPI002FDFBB70